MSDAKLLERIVTDPNKMLGKPTIKGTRLSVEYILDRLAHGSSYSDILSEYDGLTSDDISACLLYAKVTIADLSFMPVLAEAS